MVHGSVGGTTLKGFILTKEEGLLFTLLFTLTEVLQFQGDGDGECQQAPPLEHVQSGHHALPGGAAPPFLSPLNAEAPRESRSMRPKRAQCLRVWQFQACPW